MRAKKWLGYDYDTIHRLPFLAPLLVVVDHGCDCSLMMMCSSIAVTLYLRVLVNKARLQTMLQVILKIYQVG